MPSTPEVRALVCRGIAVSLRDEGSMEGLLFANITIESLFYERVWWGGAEPIHITAMPRAVNVEVRPPPSTHRSPCMPLPCLGTALQISSRPVPASPHPHAYG